MLTLVNDSISKTYYDCMNCGACCAHFRVSFYAGETDFHTVDGVPVDTVEAISPFRVCMQGTRGKVPRCTQLNGVIGKSVSCQIYQNRSTACRDFEAGSEACIRARIAHGLEPDTEQVA